jgi:hypothetical protein
VQYACEGEAPANDVVALEGVLESEAGASSLSEKSSDQASPAASPSAPGRGTRSRWKWRMSGSGPCQLSPATRLLLSLRVLPTKMTLRRPVSRFIASATAKSL